MGDLAALVRAGLPPATAWRHAVQELGGVEQGGDVVALRLRAAADLVVSGRSPLPALRSPPAPPVAFASGRRTRRADEGADRLLGSLAASWGVHERTGAAVADLLDTLARALRDEREGQLSRRAALAAPTATARVLVALPLLGVLLGEVVGARPVAVLVGTGAGRVSALVGLVCAVTGVLWTRRLLRAAGRPSTATTTASARAPAWAPGGAP